MVLTGVNPKFTNSCSEAQENFHEKKEKRL